MTSCKSTVHLTFTACCTVLDQRPAVLALHVQLDGNGTLHVEVWNPLGAPRQVGYTLRVAPRGMCLNDCSAHGTCDEATGLCTCTVGAGVESGLDKGLKCASDWGNL